MATRSGRSGWLKAVSPPRTEDRPRGLPPKPWTVRVGPDLTCSCGAELRIGSTGLAAREAECSAFHEAHRVCRERDADHSRQARDAILVLGERLADATRDLLPWIEGVAESKEGAAEYALNAWDELMNAEYRVADEPDDEAPCARIMVGSGTDTYDPTCDLMAGHAGPCKSRAAIDQHRLDD